MRNNSGRRLSQEKENKISFPFISAMNRALKDFLSGPVANQPGNAGNTGLIPEPEDSACPREPTKPVTELLSWTHRPCSAASHHNEKPEHHNRRGAPTHHSRESPHAAANTQHSHEI